jgi:hypothetical protein
LSKKAKDDQEIFVESMEMTPADESVDAAFYQAAALVIAAVKDGRLQLIQSQVLSGYLFLKYEDGTGDYLVIHPQDGGTIHNSKELNFKNLRPALVSFELKKKLTIQMVDLLPEPK